MFNFDLDKDLRFNLVNFCQNRDFFVRNFLSTSNFDFSAKSSPNSMILDFVESI